MNFKISVDTGGTFTDVVVSDGTGKQTLGKALTTAGRVYDGMREALVVASRSMGLTLPELLTATDILIYGTTHATNAVVTKRVAKTAFLTTAGFPDILVLKEGGKFDAHDFRQRYSDPIVPRRHTFEIDERVDSEGLAVRPLNEQQALEVVQRLEHRGFEAVAICFLWSIANPVNELRMGELLTRRLPKIPFTLSHELIPVVREYRRASATAIDASLKPLMQAHLLQMERDLRQDGYHSELLVSTGTGGCMRVQDLVLRPIHILNSGPAMAPVAARVYARHEHCDRNVIVCDTGGTTFDVSLISNHEINFTRETWLGRPWVGDMLGISSVDVRSIGAGGGSIAWIDSGGLLRLGPQSAGSSPGPACYGRGGEHPTVTDAAVVLGYLNPENFLSGRMKLDRAAADAAIGRLAKGIRRTAEETASAVLTLANESMIKAIQEMTISQGVNPRQSVIVGGGGAAGLNILPIGREIGCERVIIPKTAGALSACGMQFSDIVAEHSACRITQSNNFDRVAINTLLDNIDEKLNGFRQSLGERVQVEAYIQYFVEARYRFQVWEIEVTLPHPRFRGAADVTALLEEFHRAHERIFAVRDDASPVECLNWRGRLSIPLGAEKEPTSYRPSDAAEIIEATTRSVYFDDDGWLAVPILDGRSVRCGERIQGPAIIEEPTTTIVVYPRMDGQLTSDRNFVFDVSHGG